MPEIPEEAVNAAEPWDLLEMLKDVKIQFWRCLNPGHKDVTWDGDVAECDHCGLTSQMTTEYAARVRAHAAEQIAQRIEERGTAQALDCWCHTLYADLARETFPLTRTPGQPNATPTGDPT
jgi:hypothetical protein